MTTTSESKVKKNSLQLRIKSPTNMLVT